jgi:outer membrane protein OmpA-like peptidoglycan-associated protein
LSAPARRKTDPLPARARHLVWLAPLALTALAGCASRNDLYVLLPGKDGKTGALVVESVGSVDGVTSSEAAVKQDFGPALEAQPKRPVSFFLYFLADTDEFAPESKVLVNQIFAEIARRPAPEIAIIGHTDRVGAQAYNDALSLRRAERCRDELLKLGIPKVRITVAGRGEREPEVPTADEVAEPRNRRVEISVR